MQYMFVFIVTLSNMLSCGVEVTADFVSCGIIGLLIVEDSFIISLLGQLVYPMLCNSY